MTILGYFRNRILQSQSTQFWALIEQNEIKAALTFYQNYLSLHQETEVSKSLRATYCFYRWHETNNDQEIKAVELLAVGESANSQVVRVAHVLRRHRRELKLAEALRQRNSCFQNAPFEPADLQKSATMESLALAILETYYSANKQSSTQTAHNVQKHISPQNHEPNYTNQKLKSGHKQLLLWSFWVSKRYSLIFKNEYLLDALTIDDQQKFLRAAIYAWGKNELSNNGASGTLMVLEKTIKRFDQNEVLAMIIRWGLFALELQTSVAADWFLHPKVQKLIKADSAEYTLTLFISLAHLRSEKYALGRDILDQLADEIEDEENKAQIQFLKALSFLVEARNRTTLKVANHNNTAENQDGVVHNRAMWSLPRDEIKSIANELSTGSKQMAWRGHLLLAFLAYVDSNSTLSANELAQFNAAIEHVDHKQGQSRLKEIESILVTKSKATEEAINYIHKKAYIELRELYDKVLIGMGDAIPALVRAAVFMTLWEGNASYDPLPDLQRIPQTLENETLINDCILQVQTATTLKRLEAICKRARHEETTVLPSLITFAPNSDASNLGHLALAVIKLQQKKWQDALDVMPAIDKHESKEFLEQYYYAQFYAAWQLGDMDICTQLERMESKNRYLARYTDRKSAVEIRNLIATLEEGGDESFLVQRFRSEGSHEWLIGLTIWLLNRKKMSVAMNLLNTFQQTLRSEHPSSQSQSTVDSMTWTLPFLIGLTAACLGQYTSCIDSFNAVISLSSSTTTNHVHFRKIRGWAKLFRLQAELALVNQSTEDIKQRWPSVRRSFIEQAEQLKESPLLEAYRFLMIGLVSYLATDSLIDESIISRLVHAQRTLHLSRHADFLQQIIGQLSWRKKVISDFWSNLRLGDLKQSQAIYNQEIAPAFNHRVPYSIQLGMVIVDWNASVVKTSELIKRLDLLEHEATEIDQALIFKVKEYITEGDKIRHFTELVKKNDFDDVIEFVGQSDWAKSGSFPVPVAIALLYAYYRKEQLDDAEQFASVIRASQGLANWVRDYGFLILGYVYHRQEKFKGAAKAFEQIRMSILLEKHDVDKYWGISYFKNGLQLLAVEQKDEAFDAFRRSMGQRGASQGNVNLVPLFTHFGLKNIEARNGGKGLQAFRLMKDSLEGLSDEQPDIFKHRLLADMGSLLCKSLMTQEKKNIPKGSDFLLLLERLLKYKGELLENERYELENILRIMIICQELRSRCLLDVSSRDELFKLRKDLEIQVEALELLSEKKQQNDPMIFVLKGLMNLRLKSRANIDVAIKAITQAQRLGIHSTKLVSVLTQQRALQKAVLENTEFVLDVFDMYLMQGEVPKQIREYLVRQDDVAELYRLNRSFLPKEIVAREVPSSITIMEKRTAHLICAWIGDSDLAQHIEISQVIEELEQNDASKTSELFLKLAKMIGARDHKISETLIRLDKKFKNIKHIETQLLDTEQNIIQSLCEKINQQSLATPY